MTIPAGLLTAIVIICLLIVAATPVLLLTLWIKDWKRKSLW
jgi:hypothetical protein